MIYDMLGDEQVDGMVKIITERVLTPVLYMYCDEIVEFVCFFDPNITNDTIRETEQMIYDKFGIRAELVDIREFEDHDRWDIVMNAEPVYVANDFLGALFETAMYAEMQISERSRREVVERMSETGTYYMQ